jgi:hypothetical protein
MAWLSLPAVLDQHADRDSAELARMRGYRVAALPLPAEVPASKQPRTWTREHANRLRDRDHAIEAAQLVNRVGLLTAAGLLGVNRLTLKRALDRHGLEWTAARRGRKVS